MIDFTLYWQPADFASGDFGSFRQRVHIYPRDRSLSGKVSGKIPGLNGLIDQKQNRIDATLFLWYRMTCKRSHKISSFSNGRSLQ